MWCHVSTKPCVHIATYALPGRKNTAVMKTYKGMRKNAPPQTMKKYTTTKVLQATTKVLKVL